MSVVCDRTIVFTGSSAARLIVYNIIFVSSSRRMNAGTELAAYYEQVPRPPHRYMPMGKHFNLVRHVLDERDSCEGKHTKWKTQRDGKRYETR